MPSIPKSSKQETLYQHPEGPSVKLEQNGLICTDESGKSALIPIGPDGLVMLGMRLIEAGKGANHGL